MLSGELFQMLNQGQLFEMSQKEKAGWKTKLAKIIAENSKLEAEIEEIKNNKIFENAFEWRFEFPEVLDNNGDFVGFDVVIGNPPYGVSIKGFERNHLVANVSKVPDYEIYYWFIDRGLQVLKDKGISSLIIPNSILFNVFAQEYRLKLFDNWGINEILDCTEINIFEDATVRNVIFQFTKNRILNELSYRPTIEVSSFEELESRHLITINKDIVEINNQNWGLIFKLSPIILDIVKKIKKNTIPLFEQFPETSQGLIAYDKYKGQSKELIKNRSYHHFENQNGKFNKWLYGEDVIRYRIQWNGKEYIDYCQGIANPREPKYFIGKRLLIREITNPRIFASITDLELYNDPSIVIVKENLNSFSIESLLAIINSKLATFYHFNSSPKATKGSFPKILVYDVNNFPLSPKLTKEVDEILKPIVLEIIEKSKTDPKKDTSSLESQIDQLVYQLYELTPEEIAIIEESVK
ncbi:MAG: hypothetical protein COW63_03405 [Bacteroidetes bacterium CG18_big_fil_WC_8_21_14_2_50_41_14]|nr:MAG: hypothetical protein COW63_03405 [Bacteroidetes bacterium CG18_big_fil_WC_8_21_14_2_50_41_14]